VIVSNLRGSTNCTRQLAHLLSPSKEEMLKVSVARVLHGMMQYIENEFQHQMTPRVKTTHRHHRALLLLGSAAIISSLRGCLDGQASMHDFNDSILQFAVSHDITKEWIQLALPDGKQCFVGKHQIKVQGFQSLLQIISINSDNPDIKRNIENIFENFRTEFSV